MSKHQVFLVHGMGNFEKGWSASVKQLIVDCFARYPQLARDRYIDNFEFKEITYADVFESWRQQWKKDAAAAAKVVTALGLDGHAAARLVELASAPTGNRFWQTHVLDVVMYRFLMPLTEEVRRSVQAQIVGHIDHFPVNARPAYSVIAHSLGTAVSYETFHAMLTDPGGLPIAYRPVNVFAVANVSKSLWNRGGTCYPPEMGPSLSDHDGLCLRFANFSHALDPFSNFERFDPPPPSWFGTTAPPAAVYRSVELPAGDIQDFNVHGFEHYLGHPDVHVPLLRTLTKFDDLITDAEHEQAVAEWRKKLLTTKLRNQAQAELRKLLTGGSTGFGPEIESLLALRESILRLGKPDGES